MYTIPNYIHSFILSKLCNIINYNYQYTDIDLSIEYNIENETNKLLLNLSLVCKKWLKYLQNNIKVSIGFQYLYSKVIYDSSISDYVISNNNNNDNSNNNDDNQFSIIKINNIKILKIYFDSFTQKIQFNKKSLSINFFNENIGKLLPNLEYIIIRNFKNYSIVLQGWNPLLIQNKLNLNQLKLDEHGNSLLNFEIFENEIRNHTTIENIDRLKQKIPNIKCMSIKARSSSNVIYNAVKLFSHSLRYITIEDDCIEFPWRELSGFSKDSFEIDILKFNSLREYNPIFNSNIHNSLIIETTTNYLQNIEYYDIPFAYTSIRDIYYSIYSSPNLKSLKLSLCFDTLIYFLSNQNEKTQYNLKLSICDSLVYSKRINNPEITQSIFNHYWEQIINLFKDRKYLNSITINNPKICSFYNNNKSTDSFLNQFIKLILNIENLQYLNLNNLSNLKIIFKLFQSINNNNNKLPLNIKIQLLNNNNNNSNNIKLNIKIQNLKTIIQNNLKFINSFYLYSIDNSNHPIILLEFKNNQFKLFEINQPNKSKTSDVSTIPSIDSSISNNNNNNNNNKNNENLKIKKKKKYFFFLIFFLLKYSMHQK